MACRGQAQGLFEELRWVHDMLRHLEVEEEALRPVLDAWGTWPVAPAPTRTDHP